MPESNKAAKKRIQKANRAAGIGDENGRLTRVKDPPKKSVCTVCQHEMTITKTNTELKLHSESKHGKTIEECFPGASAVAAELIAAVAKPKGGGGGASKPSKKKQDAAGLDDLLNAGLSGGKKKGGKK
mmetsp:Transcript_26225/g.62323  ORF Transcript_26225/g.62323 Transcript_26225/m.62323 type:complete len:128 (-) Transcript_26225:369-752(-)|eukprot:CAMPEP_0113463822 /NCGR_PEP_ID=MMETSP0014_2-20120614/12869_1 /TAXON_ID=2857 /ORGANISM="Nitzschia sp." /LENGTH=127 /DNA_ID=CAMNT_0000355855 /DNA_START=140 /DNA_END=523 /DNA_ORIENTATION=+ /assembly_acc=CAM_ASM_000159